MKTILVVDDHPEIAKVLAIRLETNGYQVTVSNSGRDAIAKALAHKPDLIIMDIMMPHLSGGDAVRLLKQHPESENIPVLFLTAVVATDPVGLETRGINVDGKFYKALAKPYDPAVLLTVVKSLLGS